MKKKRVERVERRRPLVEPNLVAENKARPSDVPKGVVAALRRAIKGQR